MRINHLERETRTILEVNGNTIVRIHRTLRLVRILVKSNTADLLTNDATWCLLVSSNKIALAVNGSNWSNIVLSTVCKRKTDVRSTNVNVADRLA